MAERLASAGRLELKIEQRPVEALKPYGRNARVHSTKQIAKIAASIQRFGFVAPVLVGEDDVIIAGHGRLAAAKELAMAAVPVIKLGHLTPAERRAYIIADNRLAELASWDTDILAAEVREIESLEPDFELEIIGFEGAQLDELLGVEIEAKLDPKADQIPEAKGPAASRQGDLWVLGKHRVLCGDARDRGAYDALMAGDAARMAITDPPYNVRVVGNVGGKGKTARREFVMASGEMTKADFTGFLTDALSAMADASLEGSIHYVFMDWRHMGEVLAAGAEVFGEPKNLVVWNKSNAGMGAFYRSQHELVFVFKKGEAAHLNTFGLGESGRYRSNVWSYPGLNTFRAGRDDELAMHPTVKPVALIADAIRDVSKVGEIVLDPFGGSGTTLIAAQKTKRRARLIELDPLYVDVTCRRWMTFAKLPAMLESTGETFDAVAASRGVALEGSPDA